ncbi:MAG: hypothetical protein ABSE62_04935 [Chthoniobacteraceae bacterium]|jgi:hypothetical protein
MHRSEFRDASDRPEASYWPEIDIDTPLDVALELIAKQSVTLPANVQRPWFNAIVAKIMMAAIEEAKSEDRLRDLFNGAEPSGADIEMTARLLAEIATSDNCRLQAKCMQFVLELTTESQTEIARGENVGKAAVSKRCIRICEALGLPPSRGMKKEKTRKVYADRQRGKRSRPPREPWAFLNILRGIYATC